MESDAIREQIERILHSQSFASKGQLRKLLEVLSKHLDAQSVLSPELVIRELWPDETKTKRSADVATEMNRLRHALDGYYEREGKQDPVRVVLPSRAAVAVGGTHERRWIAVELAEALEERHEPVQHPLVRVIPGISRKRIAAIVAFCVFLGLLGYLSIRSLVIRGQPSFARVDGSSLTILNGEGQTLWEKTFPERFASEWFPGQDVNNRVWVGDLEGHGHTSVLFVYSPASPASSSTLICYSDRGKERWRWTPGRDVPELAGSPPTFKTAALRVLKGTQKTPARIVVSSALYPWWPNQIAIVDSNGKTVSEYWHSGVLSSVILADLDGDGREEIIATGIANGYDHRATLVLLDPDRVFGASIEVRPAFQLHDKRVAQERLRLLFQRSDLNKALFQMNVATSPSVDHGSLRLIVEECRLPAGCGIWYQFDKAFHLIAAYAGSDEFRSAHERFYQAGKNPHRLSESEQAAFLKVRCLVGCPSEFVPVGHQVP
jgi:hypothetical protein